MVAELERRLLSGDGSRLEHAQEGASVRRISEVPWERLLDRLKGASGVTVVIPVYNGGRAVGRCLQSVCTNTHSARIVVIDDGSTDPQIIELLDSWAASGRLELIRHTENWGYTRTANHALELSDSDDLVLLNSDTEVGPLWLERMRWVAYSRRDVATVTAASDNAGAMSLPLPDSSNRWPSRLRWEEIARGVARMTETWDQVVPTGHGFCMYMRRTSVNVVGRAPSFSHVEMSAVMCGIRAS